MAGKFSSKEKIYQIHQAVARGRVIQKKIQYRQGQNTMIVYTVGTFDLLHVGHLALLEYCKTLGGIVAVGVASDSVVNSYKPNKPVIPLDQRMEMLRALRCVDIVRPYHELEYVSACEELEVDIFVIGEDWGRKPHNLAVEDYLRNEGKSVSQIRYSPRTSSTGIKKCAIAQSRNAQHLEQTLHRRAVMAGHQGLAAGGQVPQT